MSRLSLPLSHPLTQQSALQDQPLLLEDLLEQEKREQEKQQAAASAAGANVLLSDADFERLRADYLDTVASPPAPVGPPGRHMVPPGTQQTLPGQHRLLGPSGEISVRSLHQFRKGGV